MYVRPADSEIRKLINDARELTECIVYDNLYANADSLIALVPRCRRSSGYLDYKLICTLLATLLSIFSDLIILS